MGKHGVPIATANRLFEVNVVPYDPSKNEWEIIVLITIRHHQIEVRIRDKPNKAGGKQEN